MKTRQMKKLHLGEFAEFILPFTAVMGDKVNDEEFGVFVTEFSQFLNANHMGFGFLTLAGLTALTGLAGLGVATLTGAFFAVVLRTGLAAIFFTTGFFNGCYYLQY